MRNKAELLELFAQLDFRPSSKRGQNFLIDPNMCRAIVTAAELDGNDIVLEIGPGACALTRLLCEEAGVVVAVEIDRRLFETVEELAGERPNLRPILGDVIRKHHYLNTEVEGLLQDLLGEATDARLKVVSNLPYSSATPAIVALMAGTLPVERMVLTVQKEIADRVAAAPGTKDYGLLSVTVQAGAEVRVLRRLPPEVFWPKPKVASATIEIRPCGERAGRIHDRETFAHMARALFAHRRKTALKCLRSAPDLELGTDPGELLAACDIDPKTRGEALTVAKIIELANSVAECNSR